MHFFLSVVKISKRVSEHVHTILEDMIIAVLHPASPNKYAMAIWVAEFSNGGYKIRQIFCLTIIILKGYY